MFCVFVKNWLDPNVKPDHLTHSVTTMIKNTITFVVGNVRKLLYMSTKQNLDWIGLTHKQSGIRTIRVFSYKKGFICTEKQLPFLWLDIHSGPILESKGRRLIFQKKGKKGQNIWKFQKKMYNIWKYFEKGQVIACNYCTQ